jgi:molybdopterin-containing oxidoreductase family iron-sulfur binding subunit
VNVAAGKVRQPAATEMEISFFETVNAGGGQYANNPWLMEMPDPITRCVWGNYLALPVKWDGGNSFTSYNGLNDNEMYSEADRVEVTVNGSTLVATCIRQFGQLDGTFALALGYGRVKTGIMGRALGEQVGIDVYPWLTVDADGNTQYYATNVAVSDRVDKDMEFACVQYHHTMGVTTKNESGEVLMDEKTGKPFNVDEKTVMTLGGGFQGGLTNRSIIYQGKLDELDELIEHIHERRAEAEHLNSATLYPYEEYKEKFYTQGHHWGMHVDLNACIGCGACQVACIAENNVPIVGKHEVHRHHEMTWMRIDRYFFGDYENPNVVYQPMMCQHCDNAPCENVCPVAATNHSSEGLNQMTYNRCIGTRYCANNCPYKVRRFNWLDYTTADLFAANEVEVNGESLPFGADNLTRMVLNPDVTVRSRGVIEKCSFCVQRIQEGKLTAKREQRRLHDNDVKTACQTACPTGAITFGDQNNPQGMLAEKLDNPLNYEVLEEINTRPSVIYAAKVVNSKEELA